MSAAFDSNVYYVYFLFWSMLCLKKLRGLRQKNHKSMSQITQYQKRWGLLTGETLVWSEGGLGLTSIMTLNQRGEQKQKTEQFWCVHWNPQFGADVG